MVELYNYEKNSDLVTGGAGRRILHILRQIIGVLLGAVVSCACELLLSSSFVLYVVTIVHKHNLRTALNFKKN